MTTEMNVLLERLRDFSPALSIEPGEDAEQVVVEIVMSRTPTHRLDGRSASE